MIIHTRGLRTLTLISLIGCAPPAQSDRTVELPDPSDAEHSTGGGFIAAGDDMQQTHGSHVADERGAAGAGAHEAADAAGAADDRAFVQSRAAQKPTPQDIQSLPIHLNESWWPFRAKFLGITVAEAKKRDLQFSATQAPKDFWDEQTAVEAVSVWTVLCNECHGGRRAVEDAQAMPPPAADWGQGEGLFFGDRRAYRHAFDIVYQGGPPQPNGARSEMISWKKELSREQIWSLLYFLEYQSGGIEGRFPPSLYPRRPEAIGGQ